jgi:hypothetical protein
MKCCDDRLNPPSIPEASRLNSAVSGILGRPVKPGDDTECCLKLESERLAPPYSAISTGRCAGPASWRSSMVIMQSMAQVIIAAAAPNT